jgi:hypothetical protein
MISRKLDAFRADMLHPEDVQSSGDEANGIRRETEVLAQLVEMKRLMTDQILFKIAELENTWKEESSRQLLEWRVRLKTKFSNQISDVHMQITAQRQEIEDALQRLRHDSNDSVEQLNAIIANVQEQLRAHIDQGLDNMQVNFNERLTGHAAATARDLNDVNVRVGEVRNRLDVETRNVVTYATRNIQNVDARLDDLERRLQAHSLRSPVPWLSLMSIGYVFASLLVFFFIRTVVGTAKIDMPSHPSLTHLQESAEFLLDKPDSGIVLQESVSVPASAEEDVMLAWSQTNENRYGDGLTGYESATNGAEAKEGDGDFSGSRDKNTVNCKANSCPAETTDDTVLSEFSSAEYNGDDEMKDEYNDRYYFFVEV